MNPIKVEIDAASLDIGYGQTLADLILGAAAERLLQTSVDSNVKQELYGRVQRIRDEEIREAVKPLIAAVLEQSVQATDGFGNPKGERKTFQEFVIEQATTYLTTPQRSSNSYEKSLTPVQSFIKEQVTNTIKLEFSKALEEARNEVRAAVKLKGAELIDETIARMARIS